MLTKIFYNYQLHHIGAKLSGCQTVCFYYVGAKFSVFDSRCQIVLQYRISFLTTMVAGGGSAVVFCTNFVSHTISMHVVFVKCSKPVQIFSNKSLLFVINRLDSRQYMSTKYHIGSSAVQCTNNYTGDGLPSPCI